MKIEGGSKQFPAGRYNNPSSLHATNTLIILKGLIIQKRRGEFFLHYQVLIGMIRRNFWQSLKKKLYRHRVQSPPKFSKIYDGDCSIK